METARLALNRFSQTVKTYYQHIFSATLLFLSIFIVYGQDLQILLNEALHSEALSHLLLMPFFAAFLFYLKRDMFKASLALQKLKKKTKTQYLDQIIGVAICLIAFLLYWYGSRTFYSLEYHMLSLPIFVIGVTLILFNLKTLTVLIFPVLFLFFLVPPPTEFMYTIGGTMANFNTQASYTLLKTLGLPVNLTYAYGPPTITLPNLSQFSIDLPCSGIYTLIAFAMFAAFLALVAEASVTKKTSLFILGFFIFEILNILRITTIVAMGYWFGEEIAMFIFHNLAGVILIFIGMLSTLFIGEKILKIQIIPQPPQQNPCPKCEANPTMTAHFCPNCGNFLPNFHHKISHKLWGKLLLLLLGCSLVTFTIHAPTFAIAQEDIQVTSDWQNAANILPQNITTSQDTNYTLRFLYRDESYEKIAYQDASLMYAYFPPPGESASTVYVDLGVADSISNLHSWEVCLVAWQTAQGRYPLVSVLDSRDLQLLPDVPIIARYFVFQSPKNYTQVTFYWYERATFNTGITVEQKYVRISLIILTQNSTNYPQLEDQLFTFGQQIALHWEPLKNQSLVSLGVPAQQLLLILSIGFVAFTKTTQHLHTIRKKTNNQKIFQRIASPQEKLILQTISNLAQQQKTMETRDIHHAIQKTTRKTIPLEKLTRTLNHLEEYGFIKKDIQSTQNTPKLVWKSTLAMSM